MPVPRSLLSTATAPVGPSIAQPSAPALRVGKTALSANRSSFCCDVILYLAVSLRIWPILADAVSLPDRSTLTLLSPATSNVETFTERVQEQLARAVERFLDEKSAEAETPATDGPREDRIRPQAAGHHDGVERVHSDPFFLDEHAPRRFERRDRRDLLAPTQRVTIR